MELPTPDELLERLSALPPARPLLDRFSEDSGVYLVGGAVRDLLLGREPFELDLVVEGDALAAAEQLGDKPVVHDRFGTSTVWLDGHRYDIAQARSETYARPGALPDVAPATLGDDLARRDFTVNAFALALGGENAGKLTFVPGAPDDLDARVLRILHERSFIDDPTRLLRLARYAARLSFAPEQSTEAKAREAIAGDALSTVSGARIGAELRLLAGEPDPLAGFVAVRELGIDAAIEPGFGIADLDQARRAFALLPSDGRPGRLTMILGSLAVDGPRLRALLDRLAFEAPERDVIVQSVARLDGIVAALSRARRPSEIAAAAAGAGPELIAIAGADADARGSAIAWLERLRHVVLEIDGEDLLRAGVPEGPAIGNGLRAALRAKLDGSASGRDEELRAALDAAHPDRD